MLKLNLKNVYISNNEKNREKFKEILIRYIKKQMA